MMPLSTCSSVCVMVRIIKAGVIQIVSLHTGKEDTLAIPLSLLLYQLSIVSIKTEPLCFSVVIPYTYQSSLSDPTRAQLFQRRCRCDFRRRY